MGRQGLHILHRIDRHAPGQRSLRRRVGRHEEGAEPRRSGRQRHGQHPRHRPHLPREGELPHKGRIRRRGGELAPRAQDPHQNGQVIDRARLFPVRWGQINGDAGDRKGKPAIFHRRAHPLPGLPHRRVGQAHNVEIGQPPGEIALRGDQIPCDAVESQGIEFAQHGHTAFQELTSPVAQGIWSPHKRLDPGPNLAAGGIYFRRGCPIPQGDPDGAPRRPGSPDTLRRHGVPRN